MCFFDGDMHNCNPSPFANDKRCVCGEKPTDWRCPESTSSCPAQADKTACNPKSTMPKFKSAWYTTGSYTRTPTSSYSWGGSRRRRWWSTPAPVHSHRPHRHAPPPMPPTAAVGDAGGPCKKGQAGTCGKPASCSGRSISGYCNGGSDNKCCVARVSGGVAPSALFSPGGEQGKRERFLLAAIKEAAIGGTEAAQFMAQMCHESASFRAMEEYASGAAYEGRKDLGNTQRGDGKRYKGRGFIQLTGRSNYRKYGEQLGVDLENNPSKASDPTIAAKVAIAYWRTRVEPNVGDFSDTKAVTKLINGGYNGLDDRIQKFGLYSGATARPAGAYGGPCKKGKAGTCGDPSDCRTSTVSGYCEGGSDNACCPTTPDDNIVPTKPVSSTRTPTRALTGTPRKHTPAPVKAKTTQAPVKAKMGDPGGPCKKGQAGTCGTPASCTGRTVSNRCNGGSDNVCCDTSTQPPAPPVGSGCGAYSGVETLKIAGNHNVMYDVVKILPGDLTYPSIASKSPTHKDNTMTVDTACAFARLKDGASSAGHKITINSGFRTESRQEYFWNCYQSKKCNNGNKAARPTSAGGRGSNHGKGIALDLNLKNGAYDWMRNNASRYGFIRTVSSETWHWEYRPGSKCDATVSYACH